jgi:hypothetical protein
MYAGNDMQGTRGWSLCRKSGVAGQTGGYSLILRASGVEGVVADHPFTSKQRE